MSKRLHSSTDNLQHFLSLLSHLHKTLSMTLRPRQWLYFCHIATLQTNKTLTSTAIYCYSVLDLCVVPRPFSSLTFLQLVLGPAEYRENNFINQNFCCRLTDPRGDNLYCPQIFQRSQWEVVLFFGSTESEGLGIILETEKESRFGGLKRRKWGRGQIHTTQKRNTNSKLFTKEFTPSAVWLKQLSQVLAILILTYA